MVIDRAITFVMLRTLAHRGVLNINILNRAAACGAYKTAVRRNARVRKGNILNYAIDVEYAENARNLTTVIDANPFYLVAFTVKHAPETVQAAVKPTPFDCRPKRIKIRYLGLK